MKKIEGRMKKAVQGNPELECPRLRPGDPLSLQRMLAIVFVISGGAVLGIVSLILENLKRRFSWQDRKKAHVFRESDKQNIMVGIQVPILYILER